MKAKGTFSLSKCYICIIVTVVLICTLLLSYEYGENNGLHKGALLTERGHTLAIDN